MRDFVYTSQPQRVVFGAGSLQHLAREIDALGARRALVLCTPEQRAQAERVAELLGAQAAGIFDRAVMHVPIETAREARETARRLDADCAVAIGGGSTIGLGKAIALDSGLADPRHSDHLRRQRDDADLRPHRGRPQEDRQGRARAAAHRHLRPRADAEPAGRP